MRGALPLVRPDQFRAIGDATRMRILGRLAQGPASIQELAMALDAPKGTIGHHVGVLESAGLIHVVEERRVRAVTEKRYGRVAKAFRMGDQGDVPPGAGESLLSLPLRHAIEEATTGRGRGSPSTSVIVRARMSAARARRFVRLIEELAEEFADPDAAGQHGETYGFVAAVYVPDWSGREPAAAGPRRATLGESEA